jgi:dihydrofolate reductase
MARAQELASDRIVEVAASDVGGQVLAAGLVDEVRVDVVPVVFGSGKRYFGRSTDSTCWRILTWRFRATGCFTCTIVCAVDRSERVREAEVHCER